MKYLYVSNNFICFDLNSREEKLPSELKIKQKLMQSRHKCILVQALGST